MDSFSVAFQCTAKEFDTSVQASIKEHFTAIHPSVEWKFAQAALGVISQTANKEELKIPPIELKAVTPIYGQVDIRGSSDKRNEAIRLDLIDYLSSAKQILQNAYNEYPLQRHISFAKK